MSDPEPRADAPPRTDRSSPPGSHPSGPRQRVDDPHRAAPDARPSHASGSADSLVPAESWLGLHAQDLIERLQRWAAELDAREAQLRRRAASLDRQQRRLRVRRWRLAAERGKTSRATGSSGPGRHKH